MEQRVNESNQPIGKDMSNWQKSKYPGEMKYVGTSCFVTTLKQEHTADLFAAFSTSNPENWTYLFDEAPVDADVFAVEINAKINNPDFVFYAVISKETAKAVGIFSLMRIDQPNGVIEVGNICFSDQIRRTKISTEAHYLMAKYIFEALGYRRYEWKCDALNAPSRKTAQRLGFTFEGIFRSAVIYKNRSRNTAWFSMLDEEWQLNKQAFEKWLAPENFDASGGQIKRLEEIREDRDI